MVGAEVNERLSRLTAELKAAITDWRIDVDRGAGAVEEFNQRAAIEAGSAGDPQEVARELYAHLVAQGLTPEEAAAEMARLGLALPDDIAEKINPNIKDLSHRLTPLIEAYNRGELTAEQLLNKAEAAGISEDDVITAINKQLVDEDKIAPLLNAIKVRAEKAALEAALGVKDNVLKWWNEFKDTAYLEAQLLNDAIAELRAKAQAAGAGPVPTPEQQDAYQDDGAWFSPYYPGIDPDTAAALLDAAPRGVNEAELNAFLYGGAAR